MQDQDQIHFVKEDILPILITAKQLGCPILVVDYYGQWEGWWEDIDDKTLTIAPLGAPNVPGFKIQINDLLAVSILPEETALD